MNHSDIAALMKGVAPVIAELVGKTVQPLVDQISALKQEIVELRGVDHAATVRDLVSDAIGKLPQPPVLNVGELSAEVRAGLADELAAMRSGIIELIPAPAETPDVAGMLRDALEGLVTKETFDMLCLDLKVSDEQHDGILKTIDDLRRDLAAVPQLVEAAAAALPAPEPGKSVSVEDVEPMVAELVGKAVAALPAPEPGKPGAPGKLPVVKSWEDRVYYEGECALFDGSTYQASKDTGRTPPHEDWTCIAQAGRNGVNGRSLTIRGTFADDGDYQALDLVALNGGSFVAKIDNPGPCPGEGWQLVASRGKPGAPGEGRKGDPGIGRKGDPGEPVVSAHIDDNGMLTLVNGDGSTVECDLYPVLAKIAPTQP